MYIRKLLCIGLVMTWVIPATAKMGLGVRAGFSRSWMIQKVDLDYRSGSHFGYSVAALADVSFYQRFSFRPEIVLTNQGGSYESPVQDDKGKYSASHYSLQIPLNIAYNIPISGVRMAVYAGPAADIHLRGKMKSKRMGEELFPASEKEMKPFDLGVNSGISVEYRNVFFSVNVLCGTLDRRIDKVNEESKVYQNNLTFSLGYIFR